MLWTKKDRRPVFKNTVSIFICIFIFLFLSFADEAKGKNDEEENKNLNYNLLLPPSSPGFILLDISPESVERPGTPTDLIVTILSETDNLNAIPENFSLEFAPYWFFKSKNADYNSKKVMDTIKQTLSISVATTTKSLESDSSSEQEKSETSLGLGLRFSIFRGKIEDSFEEDLGKLQLLFRGLYNVVEEFNKDKEHQRLDKQLERIAEELKNPSNDEERVRLEKEKEEITEKMNKRRDEIVNKEKKDLIEKLESIPMKRIGFKWDVAGGLALGFPDKVFKDGEMRRWGVWTNLGFQGKKAGIFGVFRYLWNKAEPDILDLGGRLVFDASERFSISAEGVYRSYKGSEIDNQWRIDGILEYAFSKNRSIALVVGKDYDGDKPGSLVARLVLKAGLGSERQLQAKETKK